MISENNNNEMISIDLLNTSRNQEQWEGLYKIFYNLIECIFKEEYKNKKDFEQEESINKIEWMYKSYEPLKENENSKKNDKTNAYLENLYTYHDFFIEIGKIISNKKKKERMIEKKR